MLLDISRAHLDSPLARVVFVTISGMILKLLLATYVWTRERCRSIVRLDGS